jgi:hypothetical protein
MLIVEIDGEAKTVEERQEFDQGDEERTEEVYVEDEQNLGGNDGLNEFQGERQEAWDGESDEQERSQDINSFNSMLGFAPARPFASSNLLRQGVEEQSEPEVEYQRAASEEGDDRDDDQDSRVEQTWQQKEAERKEEPLKRFAEPNRPVPTNECSGGRTERPSWHELSLEDKNLYIGAVQCLIATPSSRPPFQGSQYDDFVFHHMDTATRTHFTPGLSCIYLNPRIPCVPSCICVGVRNGLAAMRRRG